MKIAYVVCPDEAASTGAFWPGCKTTYWMGAPANTAVATDLIEQGGLLRIVDAVRAETRERQSLVVNILGRQGLRTRHDCMHFWLTLPDHINAGDFHIKLLGQGVVITLGSAFAIAEPVQTNAVRFGLGRAPSRKDLSDAATCMASLMA